MTNKAAAITRTSLQPRTKKFGNLIRSARMSRVSRLFVFIALCVPGLFAQVAEQNINMVAGRDWPNGDPYLQRQNEPSLPVSTRNTLHLLAMANDYRSVDIP